MGELAMRQTALALGLEGGGGHRRRMRRPKSRRTSRATPQPLVDEPGGGGGGGGGGGLTLLAPPTGGRLSQLRASAGSASGGSDIEPDVENSPQERVDYSAIFRCLYIHVVNVRLLIASIRKNFTILMD